MGRGRQAAARAEPWRRRVAAIAAQGRLVAIGGRSEGLTLDGKPDPAQPNFVSVWDAIANSFRPAADIGRDAPERVSIIVPGLPF